MAVKFGAGRQISSSQAWICPNHRRRSGSYGSNGWCVSMRYQRPQDIDEVGWHDVNHKISITRLRTGYRFYWTVDVRADGPTSSRDRRRTTMRRS
jgi:hypothetical protein